MRKIFYLLFLSAVSFVGCSKDDDGDDITPEVTDQGKIELSISFTNPTLNKYFQLLRESNKVGAEALIDVREKLTTEELNIIDDIGQFDWDLLEEFLTRPFVKNEIFFKENEFRMVSTGITYQEEKKWNITDNSGAYYITNRRDDDVSFELVSDLFRSIPTSFALKTVYYDRVEENSSTTVAGLQTKKITYTLKEGRSEGLKSIQIHTSSAIDKMFNSFHPYHTEEEDGIVRIELTYGNMDLGSIIYEVSKVERRTVTAEELTNSTSANVIDTNSEYASGEIFEVIYNMISLPR